MGGKCFNDVTRINKEDIDTTVAHFKITSGLSDIPFCYLGSTNKKETSGDIDIGIPLINDIDKILINKLGKSNVRKIGKLITCRYPVSNKDNQYVQIDLLQGDQEWLNLLYHHSSNTEYSGAHRNGAIRAILRVINCIYEYDNNELISKKKNMWSPTNGLCYVNQYRKKHNLSYNKNWSTDIIKTHTIESIPEIIFNNKNSSIKDMDSLESIINAINTYYKNECEDIFKEIMVEYESMKFDNIFIYPECIQKYKGA
jgi:hypothetical protein